VYSVVASASRFAVIAEDEINALRQMTENGARLEPHPFLKVGDRVRVKSGTLIGVEGILIRKKGRFRLVVSVEILGKSAAAEIDVSTVERVRAQNAAAA
jgi:transcription antitermination factor NusG